VDEYKKGKTPAHATLANKIKIQTRGAKKITVLSFSSANFLAVTSQVAIQEVRKNLRKEKGVSASPSPGSIPESTTATSWGVRRGRIVLGCF